MSVPDQSATISSTTNFVSTPATKFKSEYLRILLDRPPPDIDVVSKYLQPFKLVRLYSACRTYGFDENEQFAKYLHSPWFPAELVKFIDAHFAYDNEIGNKDIAGLHKEIAKVLSLPLNFYTGEREQFIEKLMQTRLIHTKRGVDKRVKDYAKREPIFESEPDYFDTYNPVSQPTPTTYHHVMMRTIFDRPPPQFKVKRFMRRDTTLIDIYGSYVASWFDDNEEFAKYIHRPWFQAEMIKFSEEEDVFLAYINSSNIWNLRIMLKNIGVPEYKYAGGNKHNLEEEQIRDALSQNRDDKYKQGYAKRVLDFAERDMNEN